MKNESDGKPRLPAASTTLVLLSYNERDALVQLLPMLPRQLFECVVAIDPGSTDGTLDVYAAHGIEVVRQPQRGRGNAFRLAAGIVETQRVIFLSTDGNEDPRDLSRIVEFLDQGYDLVIGGRFLLRDAQSDDSDDPLRIRKWGNIACSGLVRLLWRSGVWDAINGYRAFQVDSLRRLRLDAPLHEVELQSTIRAAKLGMRIKEFATRELPRLGGERKETAATWTLVRRLSWFLLRELVLGRRPWIEVAG
ncbi:MAG: glycosyltransferase [Deltaproteobacteria bacterium]|nr:glycosyltransferase [Deltaproteobacteria bacterium]